MKNSERISAQDLTDAIAGQTKLSKKQVETFLRTFQTVLEEGLISDRQVKIKGLGTFKLQWNEPRKSVSVQTGEEYIIPGHTKIVFAPESALRDLINAPYLNLNPVNINEKASEEIFDPLKKLGEEAQEIMAIISDLNGINKPKNSEVAPVEGAKEEEKTEIEKEKIDEPIASQTEETPQKIEEEIPTIPTVVAPTTVVTPLAESVPPPQPEQPKRTIPVKKPKRKWWKMLLLILLLFLLAGGSYYLWKNGKIEKWKNELIPIVQQTGEKIQNLFQKEIPQEEEILDENNEIVMPTQDKTAVQLETSIFNQPRTYDIFLTMEVLRRGAYLTVLAEKYYGNRAFWVYIYEANQNTIANPDQISEGTRVKIPKLPAELIDVNNPQTIEYARSLEQKYKQK